jgi:prepilin-type N-terminal cleavage/methylation domain-containing protein
MKTRRGFTLVELLVAMALVVFIMVIVSETFITALESVRLLKAQGDMQANLRVASTKLRSDLSANHFIGNGPNVSDQNLVLSASPDWGYFRVMQGSPSATTNPLYYNESPNDPHPSYAAVDHLLAFTRQDPITQQWSEVAYFLQPNGASAGGTTLFALYRRENAVSGQLAQDGSQNDWSVPYNRYGMLYTDWNNARGPQNSFATGSNPVVTVAPNPIVGAPAARVSYIPNDPNGVGWGLPNWNQAWQSVIGQPTGPNMMVDPSGYWQSKVAPTYKPTYLSGGDDILLTNVISFEVRVSVRTLPPDQQPTPYEFLDLYTATQRCVSDNQKADPRWGSQNLNGQFYNTAKTGPAGPAVFDTWCNWQRKTSPTAVQQQQAKQNIDSTIFNAPLPVQVVAVQMTIRVWDDRTQQAKQISVIQKV